MSLQEPRTLWGYAQTLRQVSDILLQGEGRRGQRGRAIKQARSYTLS